MDPVASIMIANHWGTWPPGISPEQYMAAYNLVTNQGVVPTCRYCEWAVFEGDPHLDCQKKLQEEHDDTPDWDDIEDDNVVDEERHDWHEDNVDDEICDGICGQPSYACTCAETESYRAFQADPATRGSYWVA